MKDIQNKDKIENQSTEKLFFSNSDLNDSKIDKIVSDNLKSISKKQFTHLDVYFDLDKRLISVEGQEKFFRPKEFDLAYLLMSNPGVVFTREKLVQKIWGYEYFGDTRTVDVHIRWIREKIENNNSKSKKILTVRGVGYKANVE